MIVPNSALTLGGPAAGANQAARARGRSVPSQRPVLTPSARLTSLVERKLEHLTEDQRALLEVVAYGEPLGRTELESVTRPSVARALELEGLLAPTYEGRRFEVRLADPKHRNPLRARISPARAGQIARALAKAVEATGARRQDDALRIACWRLVCGGGHPEIMLAGAIGAFKRVDYPLAEQLARASLEARSNFSAALLAARLASLQGRTDQAERELAALAARADDDTQRGLVALARLDNSVTWTGSDRLGILAEAEATISDPRWLEELEARRLGLLLYSYGPRAVAEAPAPLLRDDQPDAPQRSRNAYAYVCVTRAYSLGRLGRIDAAVDLTLRGHAAQAAGPMLVGGGSWWHVVMHCLALGHAGRLNDAEELAAEHYRVALAERDTEAQAIFALVPATMVGDRGRVQTAVRQVREALALTEQLGRPLLERSCHIHGALALALGGRPHEAADALAAVDSLALPELLHDQVDLICARAWAAAAAGHLPEARRQLDEAARLGDEIGDVVGGAAALHGLARLGQARQVVDRLKPVAARIEGDLAPVRIDHAEALADQDAAGLEKASRGFEALGAELLAAEAAADASVVLRHAGEQRRADATQQRAEHLAERCEGARTPALQAIRVRGLLTQAQWETVLTAATGHSSREIADELLVSPRTVENRLQHAYEQLGISSRAELAEALDAPGCTLRDLSG